METSKPFSIQKRMFLDAWLRVKENRGAEGIDKESLEEFENDLKNNLYKLWNRMSSGSYFPSPVKAVEIPKKTGGIRRLGVPTVSDRVAQAVALAYLEPKLEPIFCVDSYGYRPGKSAIDAVGVTRERCWRYNWVLEYDIRGAFDNIDHELLQRALRKHTDCKWVLLYTERWLKAPFQFMDGRQEKRNKGIPQGGIISPLLMNLFMHYAFDAWMARTFRKAPFARYADDGVVHCRTEAEARLIRESLGKRFSQCKLELHPEKTSIIYCKDARRKLDYDKVKFTFLGYDFQPRMAANQQGTIFLSYGPAVGRAAKKSFNKNIREMQLHRRTDLSLAEIASLCKAQVRGWIAYFRHYRPSALSLPLHCLNYRLVRWFKQKYGYTYRKARHVLKTIMVVQPKTFPHWEFGICY